MVFACTAVRSQLDRKLDLLISIVGLVLVVCMIDFHVAVSVGGSDIHVCVTVPNSYSDVYHKLPKRWNAVCG